MSNAKLPEETEDYFVSWNCCGDDGQRNCGCADDAIQTFNNQRASAPPIEYGDIVNLRLIKGSIVPAYYSKIGLIPLTDEIDLRAKGLTYQVVGYSKGLYSERKIAKFLLNEQVERKTKKRLVKNLV